MTEFKYCIKTANGMLLTNDIDFVREFVGLKKPRPTPQIKPVVPPTIFPKITETPTAFVMHHPTSTSSVSKAKVNEVLSILNTLHDARQQPVYWKDIATQTEMSDLNVKRALHVLRAQGVVKSMKTGRRRLYLPMSAEYVLESAQKLAVETVGKALKKEWNVRSPI